MKNHLILVRTYSFVGNQIRKISNSYYNHIGYFIDDTKIIEAKHGYGVLVTPFKKYKELKKKNKLEFDIFRLKSELTEKESKIVNQYLQEQIGKKYDILQLISIFLFLLFNINRKTVEPIDIESAFICSELIGKALALVNISFTNLIDLENLTPKDIESSQIIEKVSYDNTY